MSKNQPATTPHKLANLIRAIALGKVIITSDLLIAISSGKNLEHYTIGLEVFEPIQTTNLFSFEGMLEFIAIGGLQIDNTELATTLAIEANILKKTDPLEFREDTTLPEVSDFSGFDTAMTGEGDP